MTTDKLTATFKREFPNTKLKRGSLLKIFEMWKYEDSHVMLGYLGFLEAIGIITVKESTRIWDLAEGTKNETNRRR